jgi:alpha-ribazole phosphatase
MQIYLVRHPAVAIAPGICYGVSDVAISPKVDISAICATLSKLNATLVYSSPLSRCRAIADALSNEVIADDRLKELNFGEWELQPWDKLRSPEAELWMNDYVNVRCPGGESYLDLCQRVKSFLVDLPLKDPSSVVIVTHAGVIRTVLALIQGIPLTDSFSLQLKFEQIVTIDLAGYTNAKIQSMGFKV